MKIKTGAKINIWFGLDKKRHPMELNAPSVRK